MNTVRLTKREKFQPLLPFADSGNVAPPVGVLLRYTVIPETMKTGLLFRKQKKHTYTKKQLTVKMQSLLRSLC